MSLVDDRPKHPAQYTPSILAEFGEHLRDLAPGSTLIDPFGGRGDRGREFADRHGWYWIPIEIERWANVVQGDATRLPIRSGSVDAGMTSLTYANGLADPALHWTNPKGRRTYDLFLGEDLRTTNTGACGLRGRGDRGYVRYLELHALAFAEVFRALKPGAPFLVNCSDVVASERLHRVTGDNVTLAIRAGFAIEAWEHVETPRYKNGRNADARAPHEDVVVLRKPIDAPTGAYEVTPARDWEELSLFGALA